MTLSSGDRELPAETGARELPKVRYKNEKTGGGALPAFRGRCEDRCVLKPYLPHGQRKRVTADNRERKQSTAKTLIHQTSEKENSDRGPLVGKVGAAASNRKSAC